MPWPGHETGHQCEKTPQWGLLVRVSGLCKLFVVQDPQPHGASATASVNGKIEPGLADVLAGTWEAPVMRPSFVLSPGRRQVAEEKTLNRGWIGSCAALSGSARVPGDLRQVSVLI